MNSIRNFIKIIVIAVFFISSFSFASEVVLKSGQKIEGKILEQTDKYVKIDTGLGVPITYYMDDINSIASSFEEAGDKEPPAAVNDHSLFDFKLGGQHIDGNKIEFNFQSSVLDGQTAEALFMSEGFYNNWFVGTFSKVKLVVNLYDHDRKLFNTGDSNCVDMAHPMLNLAHHVQFSPVGFDITKDQLKTIGYFSVSTEECVDQKLPSVDPTEGVFAKKVLAAIKQGKDAYYALYSSQPTSEEKVQEYGLLQFFLGSLKDVQIKSIEPMKIQDIEKYKNICSQPYELNIGGVEKDNAGGGMNMGGSGSDQMGIAIGKVNGEWKILYSKDKQ